MTSVRGLAPHEQLQEDLQSGKVRLNQHKGVKAYSIDISIGNTLWQDDREIPIPEEGLVIQPGERYRWRFSGELFLPAGYVAEVITRSRFARIGTCIESVVSNDFFVEAASQDRADRPMCSLRTFNTFRRIRPGDVLAQVVIGTALRDTREDVRELMDSEDVQVWKDDRKLSSVEAPFRGDYLELSMHPIIHVYNGRSELDPHNGPNGHFMRVDLDDHPDGYYLPAGSFFISSSREEVASSGRYITHVTDSIKAPHGKILLGKVSYGKPFVTHPHAPYHAFGSAARRAITFENLVTEPAGITLFAGMKQAELNAIPLMRESNYSEKSVFHGQNGATLYRHEG